MNVSGHHGYVSTADAPDASDLAAKHAPSLTARPRCRKEPSGASAHAARAGTPSSSRQAPSGGGGDDYYYDEDDFLDEYTHERLPTEPAQLDVDLPESNLDLTMTFDSILAKDAPPEPADECVSLAPFPPLLPPVSTFHFGSAAECPDLGYSVSTRAPIIPHIPPRGSDITLSRDPASARFCTLVWTTR